MSIIVNVIITFLLVPWGGVIIMSPMMVASRGFQDSVSSILFATLIIGYPVLIFAVLKVAGLKFYGTHPNGWLIGFSVVTLLICLLYGFPGMLMNIRKGIPSEGYFKTETAVYLHGREIKGAEPASFEEIAGSYYAKDKDHVYYDSRVVPEADPNTFGPAGTSEQDKSTSAVFWKDHQHVFYRDNILAGADAESFRYLTGLYGKDEHHVFYEKETIAEADPGKFEFLHNGIATDQAALFVYNKKSNASIDLQSIEVVENDYGYFIKDKHNVYVLNFGQSEPLMQVEQADPKTFELLERSYAKDAEHVYYVGYEGNKQQKPRILKGANPENFTLGYDEATDSEARDGVRYYLYGKLVKEVK